MSSENHFLDSPVMSLESLENKTDRTYNRSDSQIQRLVDIYHYYVNHSFHAATYIALWCLEVPRLLNACHKRQSTFQIYNKLVKSSWCS